MPALTRFESASIEEIRAASLTTLDSLTELRDVEAAVACWVQQLLPAQSTDDALWILEQHRAHTHAPWWRYAIATGIGSGCDGKSQAWATAIWRWWQAEPATVSLTTCHLATDSETEQWLASNTPDNVGDKLLGMITNVGRERQWGTLLGRALGSERPLPKCILTIRENLPNPDAALDALLLGRDDAEIVDTAAVSPLAAASCEGGFIHRGEPSSACAQVPIHRIPAPLAPSSLPIWRTSSGLGAIAIRFTRL